MRCEIIDLEFGGQPEVIAVFVLFGKEGPVLVETGPGSTLARLLSGLADLGVAPSDVRHVLVTHIHFDHAGAAGWWARQGARVYVHPAGATHLIDPERLLASARRIYGDEMDSLWGEILAAPADRVAAVGDGDLIDAGGLGFEVLETPGHAKHHNVYRLGEVGFVGDAMAIRLPGSQWLDLPAPPPEFDLETWQATLERIRRSGIKTAYRTHFGPSDDIDGDLDRLASVLDETAGHVETLLERGRERQEMVASYSRWVRSRLLAAGVEPHDVNRYEIVNPRDMSVDGIARYWRKRAERGA